MSLASSHLKRFASQISEQKEGGAKQSHRAEENLERAAPDSKNSGMKEKWKRGTKYYSDEEGGRYSTSGGPSFGDADFD